MTRVNAYIALTRLNKPIGIFLLLWPTIWALLFAANGLPPVSVILIFVAGVVLMRSAGCAINDYADRHIDGHVARTEQRPLAQKIIAPWEAIAVFVVLALIAFVLVLQLNPLTIQLSFIAVALAAIYPFTKRFTNLPQAFLGIAFAAAIPMAFAAVTATVPLASWWLFAATVLWALAYDTIYAMVDRDDDLRIGVKSTAILFGQYDRLIVMLFFGLVGLTLWLGGHYLNAGSAYLYGLPLLTLLFMVYQYRLIQQRERAACFHAFLDNHYYGLAVTLLLLLDLYLRGRLL